MANTIKAKAIDRASVKMGATFDSLAINMKDFERVAKLFKVFKFGGDFRAPLWPTAAEVDRLKAADRRLPRELPRPIDIDAFIMPRDC